MDMTLFKKDGKYWTRFRISVKRLWAWKSYLKTKYGIDTEKPSKQNSRYIYFEKEGDYLNG